MCVSAMGRIKYIFSLWCSRLSFMVTSLVFVSMDVYRRLLPYN